MHLNSTSQTPLQQSSIAPEKTGFHGGQKGFCSVAFAVSFKEWYWFVSPLRIQPFRSPEPVLLSGWDCFDHQSYEKSGVVWILRGQIFERNLKKQIIRFEKRPTPRPCVRKTRLRIKNLRWGQATRSWPFRLTKSMMGNGRCGKLPYRIWRRWFTVLKIGLRSFGEWFSS